MRKMDSSPVLMDASEPFVAPYNATMRRALKIALLIAVPIETLNLWLVLHFPIDVGLPPGTSHWTEYTFAQALLLHYPGLFLMGWVDVHHLSRVILYSGLVVSGYVDTALVVLAMVLSVMGLRALRARKLGVL
jgi:hypothetical protein